MIAHRHGDSNPQMTISRDVPMGTTYYIRPGWLGDLNGYATFAACDVATGRTYEESDDLTTLMQRMADAYPHLALTENAVTNGCLRSVRKEERR